MPNGWSITSLENIAEINPRHPKSLNDSISVTFVPMAALSETRWSFQFSEQRRLCEVRKGYTHFAEGDVLFAKITPCMENGKAALAIGLKNGLGCGTTELHVLRPRGTIEAKYLYYFLHQEAFRKEAARAFTGTAGQLRVPVTFIRNTEIPLPPPAEQHRIVAKLEKLLTKVEACQERLDKIPTILKRFRQSVLAAACSGQLSEDCAYEATAKPWREMILRDITAEIRTGPFGSTLHKSDYISGGVPVINPLNIVDGKIQSSSNVTVTVATKNRLHKYLLLEGDIVIARRGEMGRCAVITSEEAGWLCGTGSAILRLKPGALPRYIQLVISSPEVRAYLIDASVGTTMENLNQKCLSELPLLLPPLAEQQETVRRVEALFKIADQIEERYKKAKTHIDKLTQSILTKAFRGELVSQDPNDEQTTKLLGCMKEECVKSQKAIQKHQNKKEGN